VQVVFRIVSYRNSLVWVNKVAVCLHSDSDHAKCGVSIKCALCAIRLFRLQKKI